MNDPFYSAFENQFRGSRELIRSRLHIYAEFLLGLHAHRPNGKAIDLGCGRGEWLELLLEAGFNPLGVDLDEGMLTECFKRNLPALKEDAIVQLGKLPSDSQSLVSAFHFVEHIAFEKLRTLIDEAHRVLEPGGLLILETPNPENIAVATRYFYLDPTHLRPIPAQLLQFICEYAGFSRVKAMGTQQDDALFDKANISLKDVLCGASPDYAIIAQKASNATASLSILDNAFTKDYGMSIDYLLDKAEQRMQTTNAHIESLQENLHAIYKSKSWRITAPLRKITSFFKSFFRP